SWRIRRDGELIHAEATLLSAQDAERDAISLLAGNRAFATIVHIAASADRAEALCAQVRALLPEGAAIAASANGERLVVRAMAGTGLTLRKMIVPTLLHLSGAGTLPRLWHL